jgi:hypothetical protein
MLRCCRRASYIPFPNTAAQLSDALEVALIRPLLIFCDVQDLLHKWKLEKLPLPGLARNRRADAVTTCPLLRGKRTCLGSCPTSEIGPGADFAKWGRRSGRSFLQVLISDPAHDGLRKQLRIVGTKVSDYQVLR